ncbi:uncharacterized protein [Halyomorpha halys]|uniref:uncharacterized protein n=1 Tax=Halyomorpha halys TaxID=286706 RepID=UPI0006D4E309|nr:uncharacterized protein LOC106686561 [Halyomorpha halys]
MWHARLQREFNELNVELKTLSQSELPELILMGRIMSTLPPPYFELRCVWESVPIQDRTVNSLTEGLRLIEMRLPGKDSKVGHTLIAKEPYKKKVAVGGKNQLGENHMARNCPTKLKRKTEDRGTEFLSTQGNAFICHHMLGLGGDQWVADTGATQHMTSSKDYFVSYQQFQSPTFCIQVGNYDLIKAYGHVDILVEMRVGENWELNHLKDV